MRKILLAISLCYLLISCANSDATAVIGTNNEVIKTQTKTLSERITGPWTFVGDENVTFIIEKNKVYYPESATSYDYKLVDDNIKINFDGYVGTYLVQMKGEDTLVLKDEEEQTYHRAE